MFCHHHEEPLCTLAIGNRSVPASCFNTARWRGSSGAISRARSNCSCCASSIQRMSHPRSSAKSASTSAPGDEQHRVARQPSSTRKETVPHRARYMLQCIERGHDVEAPLS